MEKAGIIGSCSLELGFVFVIASGKAKELVLIGRWKRKTGTYE